MKEGHMDNFSQAFILFYLIEMLAKEPRALDMLSKWSATELHSQILDECFKNLVFELLKVD